MSTKSTFIKLDRNILCWGWYKDINTFKLFLHLLLVANIKDAHFMGHLISRGQHVSSYQNLSTLTGLSIMEVRTAIKHLKATHELSIHSTNKFTIFTIKNYDVYQSTPSSNNIPSSLHHQQLKNTKNQKNVEKVVPPTMDFLSSLIATNSLNVNLQKFFSYYQSLNWHNKNGIPVSDWLATLRDWSNRELNGNQLPLSNYNHLADEE